ncbi:hypothetical protein J4731_10235 [Providencia rettgeri]|nr:hypothetical protein [Providencia rettgeri]
MDCTIPMRLVHQQPWQKYLAEKIADRQTGLDGIELASLLSHFAVLGPLSSSHADTCGHCQRKKRSRHNNPRNNSCKLGSKSSGKSTPLVMTWIKNALS